MSSINKITQVAINVHVGQAPIFNAAKEERPQVLKWIQWSAKRNLIQALIEDQIARDDGNDPDEGRPGA